MDIGQGTTDEAGGGKGTIHIEEAESVFDWAVLEGKIEARCLCGHFV